MEKESLIKQRFTSLMLKNVKDFFADLFDKTFSKTLKVSVENKDTNLYKEIAKNTRGLKGKLDELLKKKIKVDKIEIEEVVATITNLPEPVKEVKVSNLPKQLKEIKVSNLKDIKFPKVVKAEKIDVSSLEDRLDGVKTAVNSVSALLPGLKPKEFPKFKFPKEMSMKEGKNIEKSIKKMEKTISDDLVALSKVIQAQESGMGSNERGEVEVTVKNFPAQHIPTPVTNVSVNSLKGIIKTTGTTVTTEATQFPENNLADRRSLILYNNSSVTIYIGGSDVTSDNGIPMMAESFSPPMDAGQHMKVYGVVSTGTANVRVMEISDEHTGR